MSTVDTTKVQDDESVQITNLMDHTVGYIVELTGVRRALPAHAVFSVKAGELRELNYQLGGQEILRNYLRIGNKSLAAEFGIDIDDTPEYMWGKTEVDKCLLEWDLDFLLDALEFAPDGIKQLIVDRAIELEIPDVNKRQAIKDKMGVDVTAAIANRHAYDTESAEEEKPKRRRVATKTEAAPKRRRATAAPKTEDKSE